jgi:hypothetical protein
VVYARRATGTACGTLDETRAQALTIVPIPPPTWIVSAGEIVERLGPAFLDILHSKLAHVDNGSGAFGAIQPCG